MGILVEIQCLANDWDVCLINHMKQFRNLYERIISLESLFGAWAAFRVGKRSRKDVAKFEYDLERNIFDLHHDLAAKIYRHGPYSSFYINDPKQRHIHKAPVRDRIIHHAVVRVLNPVFEPTFIPNSFSCRIGKGTHRGIDSVERMARKVSCNFTTPCFALKCDVQKFFDSIDHEILLGILHRRIDDIGAMNLLENIIRSFLSNQSNLFERKGLPIGNLTSQLFANIYMNEFDQFVKHELRFKHYARYTDDFVLLSDDKYKLSKLIPIITNALDERLHLIIHPKKVSIRSLHQGIDFLGYVIRPHHRTIRTQSKQRIF